MVTEGAVLSTEKVVLGPSAAASLPALSEAVPAPMVMPNVPSPEILLMVTVGELVLPFVTERAPVAVPVASSVMSDVVRLTVSAPA